MRTLSVLTLAFAAAPFWAPAPRLAAQLPLSPVAGSGLTVTPAYEGWYENPDGTITLSFGYYNRNFEEVVDIPLGAENRIEPAEFDGMQPTRFETRRHWGVFGVVVPADFGLDRRVTWTLTFRGETYSIPGHLDSQWKIDALAGEAGAGNTPPVIRFGESGPTGQGPGGIMAEPIEAQVGTPVSISVWASDDGRGSARTVSVTLTWFKHQGPGEVTFDEESGRVDVTGGTMTTTATFSEPGTYVLRVRANDASGVSGAGHAQCCWTNGFVTVNVTRE